MAFTATIKDIRRIAKQVEVLVEYFDEASGFKCQDVFGYPDDGTLTQLQATNDIKARGQGYKDNLTANTAILAKIGTVITI